MASALLICGSRSLAARPGAETWAREVIRARLGGEVLLLTGGAAGPDTWAREEALGTWRGPGPFRAVDYLPCGKIVRRQRFDFAVQVREARWHADKPGPLARNRAMVEAMAAACAAGWTVRVLGLVDATSATRGTDHTLRLARAAGLTVERLVWEGRAR